MEGEGTPFRRVSPNFPHDPVTYEVKICFAFSGGGVMGEVFGWIGRCEFVTACGYRACMKANWAL